MGCSGEKGCSDECVDYCDFNGTRGEYNIYCKLCQIASSMAEPPTDYEVAGGTYCNSDTNTIWCKIARYEDGVQVGTDVVDTLAPCVDGFDSELVCNAATGFYDLLIIQAEEDGTSTIESTVATTISCNDPSVDSELVCSSIDGRALWATIETASDGTKSISLCEVDGSDVTDGSTAVICDPTEEQVFCKKWKTLAVGLDNTKTRFNWSFTLELTNNDGSTVTFDQTPTAGWTAQINQWAASIAALYPECDVEPRCNIAGGCGGLLGPVAEAPLPAMYARYVHISCCPTGVYPVSAKIIAGTGNGRTLILDFNETPEKRGYQCVSCDGTVGPLLDEDGTEVPLADLPACTFDCAEAIPVPPQTTTELIEGCDNGTDPFTNVIAIFDTETLTIEYYTIDVDGGLEAYTLIGDFVDCDSGEVIEPDCETIVIAVEEKYDSYVYVEIDGVKYIKKICVEGPGGITYKWVHESDDIAIIDEQTIVGGWAFVINSSIDPNCGVEAAGVLPGTPPNPEKLEEFWDCIPIEEIKEQSTCEGTETYRFVTEDGGGNLIPYTLLGELKPDCSEAPILCSTDIVSMCDFPNGLEDCATSTSFLREITTCVDAAGEVVSREVNDFALDGVTPYAVSDGEQVLCDTDNNLIAETQCYECKPPVVIVKPPILVADIRQISDVKFQLASQIKTLSIRRQIAETTSFREAVAKVEADLKKAVTEESKVEARADIAVLREAAVAVERKQAEVAVPSGDVCPCVKGDQLQLVIWYPCGDPENIDHTDYYLNGEQVPAFELDGNWVEVECEPCNDDKPDLQLISVEEKCTNASSEIVPAGFIGSAAEGVGGWVSTGWEAALAGQTIQNVSPTTTGTVSSWTNGDITVEQVDYASPATPLAGLTRRNLVLENPVSQGGATAGSAGFDNTIGSSLNPNAFLISFTNPIGAFGATFLDTESDAAFAQASYELYDASETLLATVPIVFPGGEDGGSEAHFVGWTRATNDVSYMLVRTGATAAMTNPNTNRLAFGDLRFVELENAVTYTVEVWGEPGGQNRVCYVYDENKELVDVDPASLVDCPVVTTSDCSACQPDVITDTVCNDADQTIDGILIPAGQPIIRKVIQNFEKVGCECIETTQETRYFNFQDPIQEFAVVPDFTGVCNSETSTVTRCDRNGVEIQVTTITVFTDDGGLIVTSYADLNGDPIPEPLLPLSICNPDVEPVEACIVVDGVTTYGVLHVQYDGAGNPGYDVSTFTSNAGESQVLGSTEFKLNCNEKCVTCVEEFTKYCFDVSGFSYTCPTSTIVIDGEVIDLCGDVQGNGQFTTTGDILTNGGIRSENDAIRHPNALNNTGSGYDPSLILSDALNVAANPASIGGATHAGNTTVKVLFSGDLFGLSGTSPLITLGGTWVVGSGIGVGVYDPVQDLILPMGSGETPATYDVTNFGVEIYNGGTGGWSGVSGPHTWTVDTSGVADLSQLIIYTVVINPTGDELVDLVVNGQPPLPQSCDITDQETLIETLTNILGDPWTVEGDSICTITDAILGPITCGPDSVDPVITVIEDEVQSQRVHLDQCSIAALTGATIKQREVCVDTGTEVVEAYAIVRVTEQRTELIRLEDNIGTEITGTVVDCPCPCDSPSSLAACILVDAFDYDTGLAAPSDFTQLEVLVDGVSQFVSIIDYLVTSDGINKSTWYDPWIALINAIPDWSMTLEQDVLLPNSGKPQWRLEYSGATPSTIRFEKLIPGSSSPDIFEVSVDASGNVTTLTDSYSQNIPWDSDPFNPCP